jgi:hypothetical protein
MEKSSYFLLVADVVPRNSSLAGGLRGSTNRIAIGGYGLVRQGQDMERA